MNNNQAVLYLIPRATYYNKLSEVIASAEKIHREMFEKDRFLYTTMLYFKDATYYSKSLIMQTLLKNSVHKLEASAIPDRIPKDVLTDIEDWLMLNSLFNENITHALKMLLSLKKAKINNNRTGNLILKFLCERGNLDTIAIKYRVKIKDLFIHAFGLKTVNLILKGDKRLFDKACARYGNHFAYETFIFCCSATKYAESYPYKSALLREYFTVQSLFRDGKAQCLGKTNIPIEVLEGFASSYGCRVDICSLLTKANVSEKQKIQIQNRVAKETKEKIKVEIDFSKYSILDLIKYKYSQKEISETDLIEIEECIKKRASLIRDDIFNKHRAFNSMNDKKIAIIVDLSDSMKGDVTTPLHPMFKALALQEVLSFGNAQIFTIGGGSNEKGFTMPLGDTDLCSTYLSAVNQGYNEIFIISDGYTNRFDFDSLHKKVIELGHDVKVTHFNPVLDPKTMSFKSISEDVLSLPFFDENNLDTLFYLMAMNSNLVLYKDFMIRMLVHEVYHGENKLR